MTAADIPSYPASSIKRRRATAEEMEERAEFLIGYAAEHGPVTVRQLYYQAEVRELPGIDKTDNGYSKIQYQVLGLRRAGRLDYDDIADATRWMRKPKSHDSVKAAIEATAAFYRKSLWHDAGDYVEIWMEKDALAGVIYPTTSLYDVPLMVTRGFSSETFCYEAIAARGDDDRPYYIYYLHDFDRAGRDAARSLERTLRRFANEASIPLFFESLALTQEQIAEYNLPTRPAKKVSAADRRWKLTWACELDAMSPDTLRAIVEAAINEHLPQDQLQILQAAEESERELLKAWAAERAA